jgi:hypothetical protein
MPRFVILRHQTPPESGRGLHWDLMLESGGALRTWALAEEPQPGKTIAAEPLPDHRLDYLDYEGPISRNRGRVVRWDHGEYEVLEESSARLFICMRGARLRGQAVLEKAGKATAAVQCTFSSPSGLMNDA